MLQALKRLKDTLRWREAERVDRLLCKACLKADGAHYMQVRELKVWGFGVYMRAGWCALHHHPATRICSASLAPAPLVTGWR